MARPWMPLYIADYLADTAHLNAAEHGAYLLMIMHYWRAGGLPQDEEQIRRITRMTARQWSQSRDILRSLFGDQWCHKRIDQELTQAIEKSKTNSANAKLSHESRKQNAERTHTQSQPQSHSEEERGGADAPAKPRLKDRRRATRVPEGLTANRAAQEAAGLSVSEGEREFTKFRNHALEKGRTCIDWAAAERNWYLKAAEFLGKKPQQTPIGSPSLLATPDDFAVKMFRSSGRWNIAYGPEPGRLGCRAPTEILAKHGFIVSQETGTAA